MMVKRCTTNMDKCEFYDDMVVDKFCESLVKKNALWSPVTAKIKPNLNCPIAQVHIYL